MISFTACGGNTKKNDDIYEKIHEMYFDIKSYTANCSVTAYTQGNENSYDCVIDYDKGMDTYDITSDDLRIILSKDKTIISKGSNTIESPSLPEDMYIFINTFFKSYYESEDTVLSVNAKDTSSSVLLQTSAVNPTEYIDNMKLWVDSQTAMPVKMHVLDKNDNLTTQIIFNEFSFK